jgi:hypothetical protein
VSVAPPFHSRRSARRRSKSARTRSTSSSVAGTDVVDWSESIRSTPVSPFSGCTSRILNTMGPPGLRAAQDGGLRYGSLRTPRDWKSLDESIQFFTGEWVVPAV